MENVIYNPETNYFIKSSDGNKENNICIPQLVWHITCKCNQKCGYCFAPRIKNEIKLTEYLEEYIRLFKLLGVQKIDISGGEPMLCKDIGLVCDILVRNNIFVTLTTNGNGSQEKYEWLIDNYNMFSRIIISLDGIREVHDEICGKEGSYNIAFTRAKELASKPNNLVRINTVVLDYLYGKANQEFIREIESIGPSEWCLIQPYNTEYRNKHTSDIGKFERIVQNIRNNTSLKVTSRNNNDYNNYWVLNPDGNLKNVIRGGSDFSIKFDGKNLSSIIKNIEIYNVGFPKK